MSFLNLELHVCEWWFGRSVKGGGLVLVFGLVSGRKVVSRGGGHHYVARQLTNTTTTIATCKYSYLWSVIGANNVTSQGGGVEIM